MTKTERAIYTKYDIETKGDKLITPIPGVCIYPILKDNNSKLNGKPEEKKARLNDPAANHNIIWTFGTLPTDLVFDLTTYHGHGKLQLTER